MSEIIQVIKAVADERCVEKGVLFDAVEEAIKFIAEKKYGDKHNMKVVVDRNNGEIKLYRVLKIVDEVIDHDKEILSEDANGMLVSLSDDGEREALSELPPLSPGRMSISSIGSIIRKRTNEAIKLVQVEEFKRYVGSVVRCVVKNVEFGNVIVDVDGADAVIPRSEQIRNENLRIGDRVKAYVQDVKFSEVGPQIILSRKDKMFLHELIKSTILDNVDESVEIKAIAREAGSKSKVAVFSHDLRSDAVGICIGVGGNRINSIVNELGGEKVDIVQWSSNLADFVVSAMAPAKIIKIVLDESQKRMQAVVHKDECSIAIGRGGQNVRLASKLVGWDISVISEDEESRNRVEEFNKCAEMFMNNLEVDELIGQLLAAEGYRAVEDIAFAKIENLISIEGFDADVANELKERAVEFVNSKNKIILKKIEDLGMSRELLSKLASLLPLSYVLALANSGIKVAEDFEYINIAEIRRIIPDTIMDDSQLADLMRSVSG